VAVHVDGDELVNGSGEVIQLRGVDRSGSEYSCTGDTGSDGWSILDQPDGVSETASIAAMVSWGVNAVRVPLNEDCWLGINGVKQAYSGANYRSAITSYVQLLQSYGLVVILDLHYNAPGAEVSSSTAGIGGTGQQVMADESHAPAFWDSVATNFIDNPGVIFDLYNEPNGISWSCWLHGGCLAPSVQGSSAGWEIAGMQQLVDTIRSTGATQPIMVGGLSWANDLSQWLTYEPTDTLSTPQIIASVHVYEGNACGTASCWNAEIAPVAAQVPVVTGEYGPSSCDGTWVNSYLDWADSAGVSYLAWNWGSAADGWSCADSPALLASDPGVPNAYGTAVEAHYQADASLTGSSTTTTTTTTTATPATTTTTTAALPTAATPTTATPATTTTTTATSSPLPTTATTRGSLRSTVVTPNHVQISSGHPVHVVVSSRGFSKGDEVTIEWRAQDLHSKRQTVRRARVRVAVSGRVTWRAPVLPRGTQLVRFFVGTRLLRAIVVTVS